MTSRLLYEAVLIELHKENAPNILLEDFNYLVNKAIYQYINKRYNIYDINQQTTDDLRVLKATALFRDEQVHEVANYSGLTNALIGDNNQMATYYVDLPTDYLHMLNCICIYRVNKTYKCYNAGDTWRAAATRLTADAYSQVLDNFWMKPTYKRPYYYIHNINLYISNPTNPYSDNISGSTDLPSLLDDGYYINGQEVDLSSLTRISVRGIKNSPIGIVGNTEGYYIVNSNNNYTLYDYQNNSYSIVNPSANNYYICGTDVFVSDRSGEHLIKLERRNRGNSSDLFKTITFNNSPISNVERAGQVRYGNVSTVRCEIRYGTDKSLFLLEGVYIDYIKTPLHIRLTQEELDWTEDKSQMLEFPDYVCQEIINELVHIVMENISDLRLQTHPVVSLSIANPAQALAPETAG